MARTYYERDPIGPTTVSVARYNRGTERQGGDVDAHALSDAAIAEAAETLVNLQQRLTVALEDVAAMMMALIAERRHRIASVVSAGVHSPRAAGAGASLVFLTLPLCPPGHCHHLN